MNFATLQPVDYTLKQPEYTPVTKRMSDVLTLADMMDKRKLSKMALLDAERKQKAQEALREQAKQSLTNFNAPLPDVTAPDTSELYQQTASLTPDTAENRSAIRSIGGTITGGEQPIGGVGPVRPFEAKVPTLEQFQEQPEIAAIAEQRKAQEEAAKPESRIPEAYSFLNPDQYKNFLAVSSQHPDLGIDYVKNILGFQKTASEIEKNKKLKDLSPKEKQALEWTGITAMPEGPEKEAAVVNYYNKWAPSVGYNASQRSIDQAVKKATAVETATAPIKISTAAGSEYAKTQADLKSKIDFVEKNGLKGIDPATGKPYTDGQGLAATYAHRMENANRIVDGLAAKGFDEGAIDVAILSQIGKDGSLIKDITFGNISDPNKRAYAQAKLDFVIGFLRKTSGAAINKEEYSNTASQFFARPGDDPATLDQKRTVRIQATGDLVSQAGNAYTEMSKNLEAYSKKQPPSPYKPPAIKGTPGTRTNPMQPKSQAEYDGYPKGTIYIDDDGVMKEKQ